MTGCDGCSTIPAVSILLWLLLMQVTAPAEPAAPPGSELRVTVVTLSPGDAAYERFGHNMLRITDTRPDASVHFDVAFNWGLFDFEEKNFIWHFIQGRLWYWMDGFDAPRIINAYIQDGRAVWEQELNLSPRQKLALRDFCMWNAKEENRGYRYDYYRDNCSTRIRDALNKALDGQLRQEASAIPSDVTFRSETSRLMAPDWLLYTCLYFVLGQSTDRKLSAWDEMFIPMRMRERLNQITIVAADGNRLPLVKAEWQLSTGTLPPPATVPPNRLVFFLLAGLLLAAGIAGGFVLRLRTARKRLATTVMLVASSFWLLLAGAGGLVLLFLWVFTDHAAVRPNENILQLNPLAMVLLALMPLALRRAGRARKIGWMIAAMVACGSLLGFVWQILPQMNQVNGNILALALPANGAMAWALWKLNRIEEPHDATRMDRAAVSGNRMRPGQRGSKR